MHRIKLLTFLGTGAYEPVVYEYQGISSVSTEYIQVAIVDILKKLDKNIDIHVQILLTDKAEETNWLPSQGLKHYFDQKSISYEVVKIPEAKNNEDNWTLFNLIVDGFEEEERVYVDITHSFRYLPFLVSSSLNFLRFTKRIKIEGILYGAFEASDTNQLAPIYDLTFFNTINDWTYATKHFKQSGNAKEMSLLVMDTLLEEVEKLNQAGPHQTLRYLKDYLTQFSNALAIVQSKELLKYANKIKQNFRDLDKQDLSELKSMRPFIEVLEPLQLLFKDIRGDEKQTFHDVFIIAKIAFEFNLIQQALTLLNENIVTMVMELLRPDFQLDIYEHKDRELVTITINALLKNDFSKCNIEHFKIIEHYKSPDSRLSEDIMKQILSIRDQLSELRNNINHGGYNKNATNHRKTIERIQQIFVTFKNIQDQIQKEKG